MGRTRRRYLSDRFAIGFSHLVPFLCAPFDRTTRPLPTSTVRPKHTRLRRCPRPPAATPSLRCCPCTGGAPLAAGRTVPPARALRAVSGCALLAVLFRSSVPAEQRPLAAPRSAPPRGPTAGRARTIRVGPPRGRCVHPTVMGDRDTRSPRRDGFPLSNTDRCSCCLVGRTERRARRVLHLQSFLEPVAGNAVHDQRTFPLAR